MAVNVLILISQLANVLMGGDPDEMTSARAWRERHKPFWGMLCWYLDNASPLMWWRGNYSSHCEACYWAERQRVLQRVKDYEKSGHELNGRI